MITMDHQNIPKPEVGQEIYLPPFISFDRAERDFTGGRATIKTISTAYQTPFIDCEEIPHQSFNYQLLWPQQEKLKTKFGKQKAQAIQTPYVLKAAQDNLEEAITLAEEVAYSVVSLPDVFNDGDKESIKVISLALKRLKNKLDKKVKL